MVDEREWHIQRNSLQHGTQFLHISGYDSLRFDWIARPEHSSRFTQREAALFCITNNQIMAAANAEHEARFNMLRAR